MLACSAEVQHRRNPDIKAIVYFDSIDDEGVIVSTAQSTIYMDIETLSHEYPVGRFTGDEDEDRLHDPLMVMIPKKNRHKASIVFQTCCGVEIPDPRPRLEDRE